MNLSKKFVMDAKVFVDVQGEVVSLKVYVSSKEFEKLKAVIPIETRELEFFFGVRCDV